MVAGTKMSRKNPLGIFTFEPGWSGSFEALPVDAEPYLAGSGECPF